MAFADHESLVAFGVFVFAGLLYWFTVGRGRAATYKYLQHKKQDLGCPDDMESGDQPVDSSAVFTDGSDGTYVTHGTATRSAALSLLGNEKISITTGAIFGDDQAGLADMLANINASEYYGQNKAGKGNITSPYFAGSHGFSLTFRRTHLGEVEKRFPYLKQYFSRVLLTDCNMFYVNILECRSDGQDYHVDEYFSTPLRENRP